MSAQCACSGTLQNTGLGSKNSIIADGTKLIAVQVKADDGSFNEIPEGTVIDSTFIDGLVNNTDQSKKWFPIGDFRNVTDTRADPVTEAFSDGSTSITQQGLRTFVGWLIAYPSSYLNSLNSFKCTNFGVYAVDDCGGLIGKKASNGALRPIRVNNDSWYADYTKASDTEVAKIPLQFEFDQREQDKDLRVITKEQMVDVDLTELEGLVNVVATISGPSGTGFTAKLITEDGTLSGLKVIGWVDSDFTVFNTTTNSAVVITSVTEAPEGTYTFVIPAQTSLDVLRLTGTKAGFDLPATTFTIP